MWLVGYPDNRGNVMGALYYSVIKEQARFLQN